MVLGGIGMRQAETFEQRGHTMLLYESVSHSEQADCASR
jgi:hypothetical protein